jgi:hypothetical protein
MPYAATYPTPPNLLRAQIKEGVPFMEPYSRN